VTIAVHVQSDEALHMKSEEIKKRWGELAASMASVKKIHFEVEYLWRDPQGTGTVDVRSVYTDLSDAELSEYRDFKRRLQEEFK
jgi:hypothetical protein